MSEQPSLSPESNKLPEKPKALDEEWYARFEKIGLFQAYDFLDGDKDKRASEKKKFFESSEGNPDLDYPKIDVNAFYDRQKSLLALKQDVTSTAQKLKEKQKSAELTEHEEKMLVVTEIYQAKINEKLAEIGLLYSVKGYKRGKKNPDGSIEAPIKIEGKNKKQGPELAAQEKFAAYSSFIYGDPSPDIFAYTLMEVHQMCKKAEQSSDPAVKSAGQALQDLLPAATSAPTIEKPTPEVIQTAQKATEEELGHIAEKINAYQHERIISAKGIVDVFGDALKKINAEGWTVVEVSNRTAIDVKQDTRQVRVPTTREMGPTKLKKRTIHEIGTHVLRRVLGNESIIKILGAGLDRYEVGEEGVTTMREQAIGGKVDTFAGLAYHLPISLAQGLDGEKRDFREVYDIMVKYFALKEVLPSEDAEEEEEKKESPQEKAWKNCLRAFRGTNCKTPGIAFTKDIIYREGNIKVWYKTAEDPGVLRQASIGKYDPAQDEKKRKGKTHKAWLTKLGIIQDKPAITDDHLEQLES